ncbi:hypothetical protein LIER_23219 [Lithospermum erythrorhizon]|uniref:Integrase catalytic domain-containing protein n=1 Tax=Lithospermum erythrorhizon TaxID=34254 RepID=A0AAV3QZU8_LITER
MALEEVHGGMCGSHINARALKQKILRLGLFWPSNATDAQAHVSKCDSCQRHASIPHQPTHEMVEAKPLTWQDQEQVYQFLKEIFTWFGVPRVLVTDNRDSVHLGRIEDLCTELDICHMTTLVSYPYVNGQVEITNQVIFKGVKKRLQQEVGSWG